MIRSVARSSLSTILYGMGSFRRREGVVILMYHRVNAGLPPNDLNTPPEVFRRHMAHLKRHCRVISIEDMLQDDWTGLIGNRRRPTVVVTFDDGYRDNYLEAFPILRALDLPATVFLITGMIGTDQRRPRYRQMPPPDMMSWAEVEIMKRQGVTFLPHTHTHPHLSRLDYEEQKKEVLASIEVCRQRGVSPYAGEVFCYPYGDYNAVTLRVMRDLGVRYALTVRPGINTARTPRHELRRTEISGRDSMFDFRKKLAGAFDGLHKALQTFKEQRQR